MSVDTLGAALRAGRDRIGAVDASALLTHVTQRDRAYLAAHPEAPLSRSQSDRYAELVQRRSAGEPVAYLTGRREFYGRSFQVTPAVLIPRPETELLIDLTLERLPEAAEARVLDLGTGSGCVAVTLVSERSRLKIVALDQSLAALGVARRNAAQYAAPVQFIRSEWFAELAPEDTFDIIVANPPYVAAGDPHLAQGDLRFEPLSALEGGVDGFAAIRTIVAGARRHLRSGGSLLFEHGHTQAEQAREMLLKAGYGDVFTARDLAGIERVSGGRLTRVRQPR
jgi:release factor glutamine methyltransferase